MSHSIQTVGGNIKKGKRRKEHFKYGTNQWTHDEHKKLTRIIYDQLRNLYLRQDEPEKVRKWQKGCYKRNRMRYLIYLQLVYLCDKERIDKRNRVYYLTNKERMDKSRKEWVKRNKERIKKMKQQYYLDSTYGEFKDIALLARKINKETNNAKKKNK